MLYRDRMRIATCRLLGLCGAVLLASLALTGCSPRPALTASPSAATDAPIFASDDEALAAATEAYAAYLEASNQISNEGGEGADRIGAFVTNALSPSEVEGLAAFQGANAHTVGSTSFNVFSMQSAEYANAEHTSVSLYVCEDVTNVEVVDSNGMSLVSPTRMPLTAFDVHFQLNAQSVLVLAGREVWKGDSFC